jgi:hypothetical protein
MKTMTQRKQYARPQMRVVELRHQCCILAGSLQDREDYTKTNTNPFDDEE